MSTKNELIRRLPTLRRQLLDHRRALFARVARTEDDLRFLGANVESQPEEEAQEETTAQLLLRLDDLGKVEITAIDAALARMARGEYGSCTRCGATIPWTRLEALPEARECVPCATAARPASRRP